MITGLFKRAAEYGDDGDDAVARTRAPRSRRHRQRVRRPRSMLRSPQGATPARRRPPLRGRRFVRLRASAYQSSYCEYLRCLPARAATAAQSRAWWSGDNASPHAAALPRRALQLFLQRALRNLNQNVLQIRPHGDADVTPPRRASRRLSRACRKSRVSSGAGTGAPGERPYFQPKPPAV